MDVKYLNYHKLIRRIGYIFEYYFTYNPNSAILFAPNDIIIMNQQNKIAYSLNTMSRLIFDKIPGYLTIGKINSSIKRGGWLRIDKYKWCIPSQFIKYDIIDFWIYDHLLENPEIINRILISRISYSGKPSETDKFQGFWIGDVRFLYSN